MLLFAPMGPEFELDLLFVPITLIGFGVFLYAARWVRHRRTESKAQGWTRVDATVYDSYEIDENAGTTSFGAWIQALDDQREYVACWAVAIQYSYGFGEEVYTGTYFLPETWTDGHLAVAAGKSWISKQIIVRCDPDLPEHSVFLMEDGAPGKPHIPTSLADRPYITTLSLR